MDSTIKEEWLKDLGKYKKGRGQLRDNHNKYCCLGVLVETCMRLHPELGLTWGGNKTIDWEVLVNGESDVEKALYIPTVLAEKVGLMKDQEQLLADLNDSTLTFEERVIPCIREEL